MCFDRRTHYTITGLRQRCGELGRISATKGVLKWEANVGIAAARAMVIAAFTARTRSTSTAMTKSTASGVAAQAMGTAAYTPLTRYTGTAPAGTSAFGADRRRMALVAYIRRRVATRSNSNEFLGTLAMP